MKTGEIFDKIYEKWCEKKKRFQEVKNLFSDR